jgi:hypothetical protein
MAPSYDAVADAPSLLEAKVGWLDAGDHLEPATFRRRHGPTAVGECPAPTAGARLRTLFLPSLRARMASCPRRAMGAPPDQPMVGRPKSAHESRKTPPGLGAGWRWAGINRGNPPAARAGRILAEPCEEQMLVDAPVASPVPTVASTGGLGSTAKSALRWSMRPWDSVSATGSVAHGSHGRMDQRTARAWTSMVEERLTGQAWGRGGS